MADNPIAYQQTYRNDLSAEYANSILDYNPYTGHFRWKERADVKRSNAWNAQYARRYTGSLDEGGYIRLVINGKKYQAHRLAWLMMTGKWPAYGIDHRNGEKDDNRFVNLREATFTENAYNRFSKNTSGFKGVSWHKYTKKWVAQIKRKNKKSQLIGYFKTPEEAHKAYCQEAEKMHGRFIKTQHIESPINEAIKGNSTAHLPKILDARPGRAELD